MASVDETALDQRLREVLKTLADVLLPAEGDLPAGSSAGVHSEFLDRVIRARPDLVTPLTRILCEAEGRDPVEEIRRLRSEDRAGFLALASVCAGGYYLNPEVREVIGYPGQEPSLPEAGESETDLAGEILEPVISRGRFTRSTP